MTDTELRNMAQELPSNPQDQFNYWVMNFAFNNKMTTEEAANQAIIKQEDLEYTGKFYDFR